MLMGERNAGRRNICDLSCYKMQIVDGVKSRLASFLCRPIFNFTPIEECEMKRHTLKELVDEAQAN